MSGYSDDEILEVAAKFVRSDVQVQRDQLGPIDIDNKFDEMRQLVSSTLIFEPNSIFYLIYLATNQLNQTVDTMVGWVDDLLQAVQEVSHLTKEVEKTSLLGDAATALLTVDSILTNNQAISSSAFTRYQNAVDQFIAASVAPNIKDAGEIVRPPQLARSAAITDLSDLSARYSELLVTLADVRAMMDQFLGLNLPVIAAQLSVRSTRLDVKDLQKYFESSASRDDKIAKCREAFLRLTTGKSVLQQYTSVVDPTQPRLPVSASRLGRASVLDLVPASVATGRSAPWEVAAGSTLILAADGLAPVTLVLSPIQATLLGYQTELFTIAGETLELDGLTPAIALTAGSRTAAQIASDVNAWAAANYPGQYSSAAIGGKVSLTKTVVGAQRLTISGGTALDILGFYLGQYDTGSAMSPAELAAAINEDGSARAETTLTKSESGLEGENDTTSRLRVPLNTVADLNHANDQLLITTGPNAGYHRISSIVRASPYDLINVSVPFSLLVGSQAWSIVREGVVIASKATDLTTQISIGAGTANSALGLTAAAHYGQSSGFVATEAGRDVDFAVARVAADDRLYLGSAEHLVVGLDTDTQLEVDPPLSTSVSGATFSILSGAALAHQQFVTALDQWYEQQAASVFHEDTRELDRVMNPLIFNKNPSLSQRNDASSTLTSFRTLLSDLSIVLIDFFVHTSSRMDASLKMLNERGMDRAYDTLMGGRIAEFFGMDKDDAANSAYLLKTMRAIAQHDLPISKEGEAGDDLILAQTVSETDADYDFSDMDDESDKTLGNAYTTEDNANTKQRL